MVAALPCLSLTRSLRLIREAMRTFSALAITSDVVAAVSRLNCIHSSTSIAGRRSAAGYLVSSSHISSITSPASFIPPDGDSHPYWLNVTLPYLDVHFAGFFSFSSPDHFETPRRLTKAAPSPIIQS